MARILVIDDEYYMRALVTKILERRGHEIVEATNGQEGIGFFEQGGQADMVLTDIFMPEKDGIETLRDLRKKYPDLKIVVFSGGGKGLAKGFESERFSASEACDVLLRDGSGSGDAGLYGRSNEVRKAW